MLKSISRFCFLIQFFLFSFSTGAQDCGDFHFENLRDTIETSFQWPDTNPAFNFDMYYDTITAPNTFYISFYMTSMSGDTVSNPDYYKWSFFFPNVPGEKLTYTMLLDSPLTSFPLPFTGYLLTENPECKIPVSFVATSVDLHQYKDDSRNIYPNPTKDVLFIKELDEGAEIWILDINGQIINKSVYSIDGIDVSGLIPGNYICFMRLTSGEVMKQQFIKVSE